MSPYDELIADARETSLLSSTAMLLHWDQQTMMPPGGLAHRSRQLAQLAGLVHQRVTAPRVGDLLAACEADVDLTTDPASDTAVNLRELRWSYDRAVRLPASLVREKAETRALAQHAWADARRRSDFAAFQPYLERNVALARATADCYGWPSTGEPWDALAEDYERGMNAAGVAALFAPLRERLRALAADLAAGPRRPAATFTNLSLPIDTQKAFVRHVAARIGFDFARGRVDESAHPFCSGQHPGDVRLTTRFRETGVADALAAVMHEAGHGMYYQGLPPVHAGTPLGRPASLGINESQSRMWENQVGRSEAFWRWGVGELRTFFGAAVSHLSSDEVYGGVNQVAPSLIRVEADEATYNLHIMVRFEIERALMDGSMKVAALPVEWDARYRDYLGVDVPDDAHGCLQDIHWSMGSFGYFSTYTLGNLYAAQIFEQAEVEIPGLHDGFAAGDFSDLKTWLNRRIHAQGTRYPPAALCERVTGQPLSTEPLMRYLEKKLRPLYRSSV